MYEVTSANISYHLSDLPPVIVIGIIGGILGSLHNFLLERVTRLYNLIYEYACKFYFSSSNVPSYKGIKTIFYLTIIHFPLQEERCLQDTSCLLSIHLHILSSIWITMACILPTLSS